MLEPRFNALAGLTLATALKKCIPGQVFSFVLIEILRKPNTSRLKSHKKNTYIGALVQ